jgi:hypothetical protein
MPLIMGAMAYFTPVLTRSRAPETAVLLMPLLGLGAGTIALGSLVGLWHHLPLAAGLGLLACVLLFAWMQRRSQRALGSPHPCLYWYLWALASLALGLTAILAAFGWSEQWQALRRFHLHLNTLGFIGLTALGTLHVLLPTVARYQDPDTSRRLRRGLYYGVPGALLSAAGAAWFPPLAAVGLLLWLVMLVQFTVPLVSIHRAAVWGWHKPSTALASALIGFALTLLFGALQAVGWVSANIVVWLFFLVFLFPLVTSAASYLLPVWIWPGRCSQCYETAYRCLARGTGLRTLSFVAAGLLAISGFRAAAYLAALGLVAFLIQIMWGLRTCSRD